MVTLSTVLAMGMLVQSAPVPVTAHYSWVYDEHKHRRHLPNCPQMEDVRIQVERAIALWEQKGDVLLSHIRTATAVDVFPTEPTVIYFIGCGRGISDPLTVSVYKGGPDGPFVPCADEDILREIAHELLHQVARTVEYMAVRKRLRRRYPYVEPVVASHILVASFEARLYGYAYVRETYVMPEYARAVRLAVKEGLIPGKQTFP
jgi:hypothetical protein